LAAVVVALLASPALAQRGPRGGGGFGSGLLLLSQKSVQEELKLTEDQVKKATEAGRKMMEGFQGLQGLEGEELQKKRQELAKEGQKAVDGILSKDQAKRLKEISLQLQGAMALRDPAVAKGLKITDDQTTKIKELFDQAQQDFRKIFEDAAGDQEAARKKLAEYRKDFNAKAMKLLTDEQRTKWKELTGKPFKGEIRFGPPRRNNN
jgi:Spy/CpxP family protein refolding chaperone